MINKSYTFTNNTTIDPEEVNQNFDDMLDLIAGAHHSDEDGTLIAPADIHADWGLLPKGGIIMWNGTIATIPAGYSFCNGSNGTIDMRNKFALCPGQDTGGTYDTADTGGEANHTLSATEMPVHTHTQNAHNHTQNAHNHSQNPHNHTQESHKHHGGDNEVVDGSGTTVADNNADDDYDVSSATPAINNTTATNIATTATNQATTATNNNAGSGGAHNNMPPYRATVFIQKV